MESELEGLVDKLKKRKFYGKLTVCFKGGEIYHYIQEENIKPKNGKVYNDVANNKVPS